MSLWYEWIVVGIETYTSIKKDKSSTHAKRREGKQALGRQLVE